MEHFYATLWAWLQVHGMTGVALFMAAESAGAPVPTGLGFAVAEGLIGAGAVSWWGAFLWINAGHLVGAGASYYLGRASDNALARFLAHRQGFMDARAQMQRWYHKYGPLAILFGRLVGHVRPWASFVAGLAAVPLPQFCLWTVVGTAAYTAVTMWLTAYGWQFWMAHPDWRVPLVVGTLVLFYGLPLAKLLHHLILRYRRHRAERRRSREENKSLA
ncbi:MAG: hypothetical protein HPY69_16045 [Armatimonadetes bacterium]|nr:hypothetical protein [Armatimonadota bacterium]